MKTEHHVRYRTVSLIVMIALLAIFTFGGCFRYSFSGAMTGDIKTLAIPLFDNRTAEYGVVESITDELILKFQQDNTLMIVDEGEADAVLFGTLIRVIDEPYTYSGEEEASSYSVGEYKLTLVVHIDYFNRRKDENIWSQEVKAWGTYDHSTGAPEERDAGFSSAIVKLSEDVLNLTVSGW
ncbi:hypothetical protein CEE37_04000 [candidate division LCP-89 bacterium B3_LCP]|uniref:Uncharacterized protein n=1 Tax=candidate division LCP-89 bacterium B3_LCP TaxID=2012998 RepID=A0A532V3E6_UNCL8|nr:MAG: hypothetical protein CEE37_04000 [candidate division LCP-89 bacterium B3_LCP]